VVESTGASPTWVSFDDGRLVDDLPSIAESQDEPFGSTSMAAQWYVMRAARAEGLTVMLDGQGGDEILGGYRAFIGFHLAALPELLRYEDRNSMAHSLEARVPFLDFRLVELLFSLPGDELIRAGETKSILRRALGDLLPPSVRSRRDKLGFVTPTARFFRGAL